MFCENCKVEIPPAWVLVITKNECPACGGDIMSPSSKELLESLAKAMKEMPNDPEGIAGWLLSNYKLEKIGEAGPTKFYRQNVSEKPTTDGPLKMANSRVQQFFKNAGVDVFRKEKLQDVMKDLGTDVEPGASLNEDGANSLSQEEADIMANMISKGKDNTASNALNHDRMARLERQKELEMGGSVGAISRSS